MEAASTRKDVIKRFWNIGCEHSAIARSLFERRWRVEDGACSLSEGGGDVARSRRRSGTPQRAREGGAGKPGPEAGW